MLHFTDAEKAFDRISWESSWRVLENLWTQDVLHSLAWIRRENIPRLTKDHLLNNCLNIWFKLNASEQLTKYPSPIMLLYNNEDFKPGIFDKWFIKAFNIDYPQLKHFLMSKSGQTPEAELSREQWSTRDKWREQQIHNFLLKLKLRGTRAREFTEFEQICTIEGNLRHSLSRIFKTIVAIKYPNRPTYTEIWESELNIALNDQD
ncbi:hypothetical protein XELAEV_18009563mg [Xenopus laevis]|uniref:Reverse transcriptase domain-containing protein n=1 Tax=Xenopus laevis TaxID=8355 RepID=A0A974DTS7_XENLA|nr:hypothetical protein XELAEV_18009563mg [Xenopus laevis]